MPKGMKRLCLGLIGLGIAGSFILAEAVKSKNMTDAMREAGFTCKTAQWSSTTTRTSEDGKVTKNTSRFWISGNKFRLETKDAKTNEIMIMIDDGESQFIYDPQKKSATKMNEMMRGIYASLFDSDAFKKAAEQRKTAKKIGTGVVSGKPCTIYAYQNTFNEVTSDSKEWVWTAKNFPMRAIVKIPQQSMTLMGRKTVVPASTTETLVTEVVVDKAIPASMFTLPAGVKVQSMEQAGGKSSRGEDEANEEKEATGKKTDNSKEIPPEVQDMMKKLF